MSRVEPSVLLPSNVLPHKQPIAHIEWTPKRYENAPQAPPADDSKVQEQELAYARQFLDGKLVKKTRPRRTVDFNGGMGRWNMLRKLRPNLVYTPQMRPCPPSIISVRRLLASFSRSIQPKFSFYHQKRTQRMPLLRCVLNSYILRPIRYDVQ